MSVVHPQDHGPDRCLYSFKPPWDSKGLWLLRGWVRPLGVWGDFVPGEVGFGGSGRDEGAPPGRKKVLSFLTEEGHAGSMYHQKRWSLPSTALPAPCLLGQV